MSKLAQRNLTAGSRSSDPDSSKEAAELMEASGLRAQQTRAAYRGVVERPGSTAGEIADRLGIDAVAINRRLSDLRNAGIVENEMSDEINPKTGERKPKLRRCLIRKKRSLTWWPKSKDPQGRLFR
jgi:predicted transcriptional regulator